MSRFIETICFEDGHYPLLRYHQRRIDHAFIKHFPKATPLDLLAALPSPKGKGKLKVRVVYDAEYTNVETSAPQPRLIRSVQVLYSNQINYFHKYEDRSQLQELFSQRGSADEILIIKNGFVTDSFYANVIFWDGSKWWTPKTYLLPGTQRSFLIDQGIIHTRDIRLVDLQHFKKLCLINALSGIGEMEIPIENVLLG
ncbi:MAG: aminotransferase class IV [Cyclobacteriaceae bacterium]|nr:aminotransferase class IV [Cyclobacteriaceae bacterium HetDA_MAG_MS6]